MPCWLHFCSMFGLRSLLDTHLYQTRGCSRKALKTHEKSTFLTPTRSGNRANFDPRRLQEVIISLLNLHLDFGSIFAPFCLPKRLPLGTLLLPKSFQTIDKNLKCPKSCPKSPQFRPKTAQDRPKRLQEAPKRVPRAPKSFQRATQEAPKKHQEHLKRLPCPSCLTN